MGENFRPINSQNLLKDMMYVLAQIKVDAVCKRCGKPFEYLADGLVKAAAKRKLCDECYAIPRRLRQDLPPDEGGR